MAPVYIQPLNFSGKSAKDKISDLRGKLGQEKAFAIVVTTLDEVRFMCLHLLTAFIFLSIELVSSNSQQYGSVFLLLSYMEVEMCSFLHQL